MSYLFATFVHSYIRLKILIFTAIPHCHLRQRSIENFKIEVYLDILIAKFKSWDFINECLLACLNFLRVKEAIFYLSKILVSINLSHYC